jgi:hypothetical protein
MKHADKIELIEIEKLIPYARNSRTHSDEQVAQIAGSIREFGFTNPVLINKDGTIVAGHGRVMAARKLGMASVPCLRLGHLTESQVRAYVIADNKLALNAGWNEEMLAAELEALKKEGFDVNLTGFNHSEVEEILSDTGDSLSEKYTHKVDAPTYTPKGEKPKIEELISSENAKKLIEEIDEANLPNEIALFLKTAASRHLVFNYEKIAEFYCHSDKKVQELMENSALVIIDINKALLFGYAKLNEEIVSTLEAEG